MALNDKQLVNLAHLCRLELGCEDIPRLKKQLGRMLDMANRLSRQNLDDSGTANHIQSGSQRLREDKPEPVAQGLASTAARHEFGMVVVPKVLE